MKADDPLAGMLSKAEKRQQAMTETSSKTLQEVYAQLAKDEAADQVPPDSDDDTNATLSLSQKASVFMDSLRLFVKYPIFLLPLIIVWIIYAPIILWLKFKYQPDANAWGQTLLLVFVVIFIFSALLMFSCSLVLELLQQIEHGQRPSFTQALGDTINQNLITMLPLMLMWSVVWFLLLLLSALTSRQSKNNDDAINAENAAKTLAGYQKVSISEAFFSAVNQGVRMVVFLIMPAIAWENLSLSNAVKKGFAVLKGNKSGFVRAYLLSEAIAVIVFFPPALLFVITAKGKIVLPDTVWLATMLYVAIAWSYSMYVEQLYAANLYLWYMAWDKEAKLAKAMGDPVPALKNVKAPSLLNQGGVSLL